MTECHISGKRFLKKFVNDQTYPNVRSLEKVCKNKDFCGIVMLSEKNNTLEFKQYLKLDKGHIIFMLTYFIKK